MAKSDRKIIFEMLISMGLLIIWLAQKSKGHDRSFKYHLKRTETNLKKVEEMNESQS